MQWWASLLTVVASGVIGGGAAVTVAWLNRQGGRDAADATGKIQMRTLDQSLIDRLQTQVDKQDARLTIRDKAIEDLQLRVDELERALDREERGRAAAIRYIRRLLDWITEHMPGATPPDIPAALREDLV